MSEQRKLWEGQPLSQEIDAQALEMVTGGVIESPTPIGPHKYLYNGGLNSWGNPGTVTLHTSDISIPDHTHAMSVQRPGTAWLQVPVPQPSGEIQHSYRSIVPR